ncbi:hypothetical protein [Bacillus sp. ES1-5]|uniref:hypothetical protein n=1 Tax=Bacillus sp. ES1-5 TaxID=1502999 RepID=UPI001F0B8927|nr:hypothetical protein [Bacillus sp. ES1-5]
MNVLSFIWLGVLLQTLGTKNVYYQTIYRKGADEIAELLTVNNVKFIRGPIEMKYDSDEGYSIDFYNPNVEIEGET